MSRSSRYALLGVLSAGVFLAGLELMVTAVALPKIILDFSSNAQNPVLGAPSLVVDRERLPARVHRRDAARGPDGRRLGRPTACSSARSRCSRSDRCSPAGPRRSTS
jgi:hypothetical protein